MRTMNGSLSYRRIRCLPKENVSLIIKSAYGSTAFFSSLDIHHLNGTMSAPHKEKNMCEPQLSQKGKGVAGVTMSVHGSVPTGHIILSSRG
jgi:hypothetical protein